MTLDLERMESLAPQGFSLATDVAEWLVRQGVAFRDAHEIAGACVQYCEERETRLEDLNAEDLAAISPHLRPEVLDVLSVHGSVAARDGKGGTAPVRVAEQMQTLLESVERFRAGDN